MANAGQFWYSTETTPLDVLGALAINFGASHMAASNANLRWIPWGQSDNAFLDARFIGGVAGIAAGMWGQGEIARGGVDVAQGLLGSFVATERVRAASIARMQQAAPGGAVPFGTPAPAAVPAPAPAAQIPAAAPVPPAAAVIQAAAQAARQLSGAYA